MKKSEIHNNKNKSSKDISIEQNFRPISAVNKHSSNKNNNMHR